jgi:uncharacterized protein (DUF1684 family)
MRVSTASLVALIAVLSVAGCNRAPVDPKAHRAEVETWRTARLDRLKAEEGWLTLVGLYWLRDGENTFGRAPHNTLVLDHAQLPEVAGSFFFGDGKVRFAARPDASITHDGQPVTSVDMAPDTSGAPTKLQAGTLRFHVIERAGRMGVRVRDIEHPLRTQFAGLDYYGIDAEWVRKARFTPYDPPKIIPIVNVLGMVEDMTSPGYLTFKKSGQEWRLDAILESPDADQLFIMFADGTSGHGTYGAGRFLYIPLPVDNKVLIDFNKAYSPPCAFNEFATCPLPPSQNRIALRIDVGEKDYQGAH